MKIILTLIMLCLAPSTLMAQSEAAKTQFFFNNSDDFDSTPYDADITQVEDFLNNMKTLQSKFYQSEPGPSTVRRGTIYISRPGKARWEYIFPTNILIIINDEKVIYQDKSLDQISYTDIKTPLAQLLTKPDIDLRNDLIINHVRKENNELNITLSDKVDNKNPYMNYLTLAFSIKPFALKRIQRMTEANEVISINLINPKINEELDPDLFIFKNPRILQRRNSR